jgi:predicted amidohydrolase
MPNDRIPFVQATPAGHLRSISVALVQFDSVAEAVNRNLHEMERLAEAAATHGARWIVFHEGCVCDCTPQVATLAERVPEGDSTRRMERLAQRFSCYLSFGLSETDGTNFFITQVFVGPEGFIYRYRKTWVWRDPTDRGYRNEWVRYDPGTGPELFELDGVKATCFICADGEAPRCIDRAAGLQPQVVFYPNNRSRLPKFAVFGERARQIGAPMLVTNRVGRSWEFPTSGGCVIYSKDGTVLAKANRKGREETLYHSLAL